MARRPKARRARRRWTRQLVIESIRMRHARGLPLTQIDDSGLEAAAREWFGSWPDAVLAAGLRPKKRKDWTRQGIIEAIQARSRQGLSVTGVWERDKGLYLAARKHLGSWHAALLAAGLESNPARKWSRQRILDELRAWHRQPYVALRKWDGRLRNAVTRYFGNLDTALAVAGLKSRRKRWTKQRVIEAIQDGYVKGSPTMTPGFGDVTLAAAAQRRFGSWRSALAAAGLHRESLRARAVWTKERVIEEIQRRHQQGLPLTTAWRDYKAFSTTAYRLFGSWRNALAAAGIVPTETDR